MLKRIAASVRRLYRGYVVRDPFAIACRRWLRDRGDETLRVDYPLGPDSVVLDVGGYHGDWAAQLYERYGCRVYVFEPVTEFYEGIRARFAGNPSVKVFNFGLSDSDAMLPISLAADASSVYQGAEQTIEIQLRDVVAVLREEQISAIDLVKINIEGGEYPLLTRMLDERITDRCRDIQVQFHDFVPDASARRAEIRARLARTHELTYEYYFVWENWRLRELPEGD
jgi:FkbM family methyltransferase